MRKPHVDQSQLFGYIHPVTGESSVHPPLCACGECYTPVERFHKGGHRGGRTFYADGFQDAKAGLVSSPPDRPVLAREYEAGYRAGHSARLESIGMLCKCGSVLSAVNRECVRGQYCPEVSQ